MGFVKKSLMPDEEVVYRAKLHWSFFLWSFLWTILFLYIAVMGYTFDAPSAGHLFLIFAVLKNIRPLIIYKTSEVVVTNKRILAKERGTKRKAGFIRRKSFDILLSRIERISVHQGIRGRLLGYGTVVVTGIGGIQKRFPKISKPLELSRKIQMTVAEGQSKMEMS